MREDTRGDAPGEGDGRKEGDSRKEGTDFIRAIVAKHQEDGTYGGRVETRFPPEPNGFLHIGHSKSIVLNFGLAQENGGVCHLRFDDTNPLTEDMKYVRAIQEDVRWLGFDWGDHLYFASDYFDRLHECALVLIRKKKAYVDSLTEEEIREYRGTVKQAGRDSPYRERSVEENLDLFTKMKEGEFGDGEHVLRARIDMAHPNMIMRDPVLYRIRHASHYRRGDEWCIYPLYDFTHCLSDAFEDITHSLCTLEFDNNREIYDWLLDNVGFEEPRTHQYEFARLNLDYTVVSKRKLLRLVNEGHVDGWDDPRMPTLAGVRRRGVTPEAIRTFVEMLGVAKADNRVDLGKLEFATRDHLNKTVRRVMGVLDPLKVVITNYEPGEPGGEPGAPAGGSAGGSAGGAVGGAAGDSAGGAVGGAASGSLETSPAEILEAPSYPHDVPLEGSRAVPFSRELYIERDDFQEAPQKGFRRLAPGREVRLRHAYFIRCDEVVKDPETGGVVELRCTYDPDTKGGNAPDGRKVSGTIHWVSAAQALPVEVRLFDRLFTVPDPEAEEGKDFTDFVNPESKVVLPRAFIEPSVAADPPGTRYQFERQGYFMTDIQDSKPGALVFNRIVTLRDGWAGKGADKLPAVEGKGAGTSRTPSSVDSGTGQDSETPVIQGADTGREARDRLRAAEPALAVRFGRFQEELGLTEGQADILTGAADVGDFFEAALEAGKGGGGAVSSIPASALANWIVNELLREVKGRSLSDLPVSPGNFAALVALREEDVISQPVAKEIFAELIAKGGDPRAMVREKGLEKMGDQETLKPLVDKILAANPQKVAEYREGKKGLIGFFMGQIMKETQGKADPKMVQELLKKGLGD